MLNGNLLRGLKGMLGPLLGAGHMNAEEARNIAAGIDVFADLTDRASSDRAQEDEEHFRDSAALRAFEALLPLRAPLMDPASGDPEWKRALALECADAADELAAEMKRRKPQRETLPPAKPPTDEELQSLFGANGVAPS